MSISLITFRIADPSDSARVAELHATSWQSAYRGFLSDAYLDTDVPVERLRVWQARLAQPSERQYVLLAEQGDVLVGFVCVLHDAEPAWGAYLDNLHVRPGLTGQGLGGRLLIRALQWVARTEPGQAMHLLVLAGNTAARRFYERHGGQLVETLAKVMPDGTTPTVCRYLWRDPARHLAALPVEP
jgi:ribosomal protein S18 acetylase RimI-like enzyme